MRIPIPLILAAVVGIAVTVTIMYNVYFEGLPAVVWPGPSVTYVQYPNTQSVSIVGGTSTATTGTQFGGFGNVSITVSCSATGCRYAWASLSFIPTIALVSVQNVTLWDAVNIAPLYLCAEGGYAVIAEPYNNVLYAYTAKVVPLSHHYLYEPIDPTYNTDTEDCLNAVMSEAGAHSIGVVYVSSAGVTNTTDTTVVVYYDNYTSPTSIVSKYGYLTFNVAFTTTNPVGRYLWTQYYYNGGGGDEPLMYPFVVYYYVPANTTMTLTYSVSPVTP